MTKPAVRNLDFSRKISLTAAGLAAITVPIVFGLVHAAEGQAPGADQKADIEGTWQGTLHAERDLRTVKITTAGDGAYKAQFFSIDQRRQPIPVTSITLEGSAVRYSIATPIPPPPPPIPPMADNADPSLEVATIKLSPPDPPDQRSKAFDFNGHEYTARNTNLNDLLAIAYGVHSEQIVGAPDWANSVHYDITGIPDAPGRPNHKQAGILLKKLLVDRFQLKSHSETRVLSVYAITVAKDGPKMTKDTGPANAPQGFSFRGKFGDLFVLNETTYDFANDMQAWVMDRPVVDQTGLTDRYDFQLKWTPDDSQFTQWGANVVVPPTNDTPNAPPNLYTAIQQQLGLKIEPTKAPDVVLVIDHVERPSAN